MSLSELGLNGTGILLILLTIIQIAPIKINPWSCIAKGIGKALNGEVITRVDKLSEDVNTIRKNNERREAINYRARILRFGDELMYGTTHSKEHFQQTLSDIKAYERYCEEHPEFSNHMTEIISKRIKEVYEKCIKENSFM